MDPAGLPISGAYVSIVSFKDQSLLASLTTDGEGHFTIPTLTKEDSILVEVGCAGFKKQYASHRPGQSLHFTLRTDSVAYTLGMAEVSVKHSTFRMSKGQFIFQPHGVDLLLPNAFEVLKYVPMLSVSEGGGVSVLGKGQSTIYINGDKPQETGPALMSRLKNIRPKDVQRVEIIRTPGSKYSASMQGAIVNVVLRDPEEGWNGMVVANAKYDSKRLSPDLTSAFTFNRKKFSNTFAAMWYGSNAYSHDTNSYGYSSDGWSVVDDVVNQTKAHQLFASWRSEYRFAPNQKFLASAILSTSKADDQTITNRIPASAVSGFLDKSRTLGNNHTPWYKPDWGGMLTYKLNKHKVGLKVSGELSNHEAQTHDQKKYQRWMPELNDFASYEEFLQKYAASNLYGETEADLSYKLNEKNRLSLNYLGSYMHTDSRNDRWNHDMTASAVWNYDRNVANWFVSSEMSQAFNVSYACEWSEAFSTELGVRAEYMHNTYELRTTKEHFKRNHFDIYPSVSLNWDINERHSLSLSYSRAKITPLRSTLNPFVTQISENVYTKGNPYLKNSNVEMVSLQYSCFRDLTFLFDYYYQKNGVSSYEWTDGQNSSFSSWFNNAHSHKFGWSVNYNKWLFKDSYQLSLSAELNHHRSFGGVAEGVSNNFKYSSVDLSWDNRFILSQKRRMQCSLTYMYGSASQSATKRFNGEHSFYLEFLKAFKNSVSISIVAATHTPRNVVSYDSSDFSYRYFSHVHRTNCLLNVTIPFGGRRVKAPEYSEPGKAKSRF